MENTEFELQRMRELKQLYNIHTILKYNEDLEISDQAMDIFHRMFIWANEMGLEGKKVAGLKHHPLEDRMMAPPISGKFTCYFWDDHKGKNETET